MDKPMKVKDKIILDNILQLAKKRGWNDAELCRNTGIDQTNFNSYKSGIRGFGNVTLEKFSRSLGVTIGYLLTDHDSQSGESPPQSTAQQGDTVIASLLKQLINDNATDRQTFKKIMDDHIEQESSREIYFKNAMNELKSKIDTTEQILLDHISKTDDGSGDEVKSHSKNHGGGKIGVVRKRKAG